MNPWWIFSFKKKNKTNVFSVHWQGLGRRANRAATGISAPTPWPHNATFQMQGRGPLEKWSIPGLGQHVFKIKQEVMKAHWTLTGRRWNDQHQKEWWLQWIKSHRCVKTHKFIWHGKMKPHCLPWRMIENRILWKVKVQGSSVRVFHLVFLNKRVCKCWWSKVLFYRWIPTNGCKRNDRIRISPFYSPSEMRYLSNDC